MYTNGDQWDGVWDGDKPHGAGLYIAYNNPDHKVKAGFIKQGDPIPTDGRGAILSDDLRKEDKVRIIQVLTLLARATRAWESTRHVVVSRHSFTAAAGAALVRLFRRCGRQPAYADRYLACTWQEGEQAAKKASSKAEAAAQIAADARKIMHKVLDDTTTMLGLTTDD